MKNMFVYFVIPYLIIKVQFEDLILIYLVAKKLLFRLRSMK